VLVTFSNESVVQKFSEKSKTEGMLDECEHAVLDEGMSTRTKILYINNCEGEFWYDFRISQYIHQGEDQTQNADMHLKRTTIHSYTSQVFPTPHQQAYPKLPADRTDRESNLTNNLRSIFARTLSKRFGLESENDDIEPSVECLTAARDSPVQIIDSTISLVVRASNVLRRMSLPGHQFYDGTELLVDFPNESRRQLCSRTSNNKSNIFSTDPDCESLFLPGAQEDLTWAVGLCTPSSPIEVSTFGCKRKFRRLSSHH